MGTAFDPARADFSGILPNGGRPDSNLCLSDVLQQTYLEVNEQGTVAAAATGAVMTLTAQVVPPPPIEFVMDRPFWVAIRDDRTGLILFMGHIVDPGSNRTAELVWQRTSAACPAGWRYASRAAATVFSGASKASSSGRPGPLL